MSTLPRKLLFLVLFTLILFVICRIEERLLINHEWNLSRIVDPFVERVRALKAILARRGISTEMGLERKDLSELVYSSGSLTEAEKAQALRADEIESRAKDNEEPSVTEFSGLAHFDELVEDCKDSAWLVEVRQNGLLAVPPAVWRQLASYLRTFDVRLGRVDCDRLRTLCGRKQLFRSGLLLAMPKGRHRMKDSVSYSWFTRRPAYPLVVRWLEEALGSRVPSLEGGWTTLQNLWNSTEPGGADSAGDFILSLDLKRLPEIPLLLSSISVRFTGRVRFWRTNVTEGRNLFASSKQITQRPLQKTKHEPPGFFIISGRGKRIFEYGAKADPSEAMTFDALQLFLKMNYPEANDIFNGLFLVVCMMALLSLSMKSQGGVMYRILNCLGSFCFYVFLFFVLYPPLVHLLSQNSMRGCRSILLSICQTFSRSNLGGIIRRDCLAERYNVWRLSILFTIYLGLVALIESRFPDDEDTSSDSEQRSRQEGPQRLPVPPYDPEAARVDHVVNYLYSSLWLPPGDLEKDYVNRLPLWTLPSHDIGTARENEMISEQTGEEIGWPTGTVYSRQCSICLIDYLPNAIVCYLPCGHVYHEKCVKKWLNQPDKDSCPNCRWPAFKLK